MACNHVHTHGGGEAIGTSCASEDVSSNTSVHLNMGAFGLQFGALVAAWDGGGHIACTHVVLYAPGNQS